MNKQCLRSGAVALAFTLIGAFLALGQEIKPVTSVGEVVSISAERITVRSKEGNVEIAITGNTQIKRVPPENPSLKAAVAAAISDLSAGDKVVVSSIPSGDKMLQARTIYLMTKGDITARQAKDAERWNTRGISGRVASVDAAAKQIKIEVRALTGVVPVVISLKDAAVIRRYADGSVKYSEAKPSSIAEIAVGDMLRAVGERGAEGSTFAAEEVITGAFRTVAGAVKAIDAGKNEVTIADIQTKKDVVVELATATTLKKFPAEFAERMAAFQAARANGQGRPGAAAPAGSGGPGGGPGGRPPGAGPGPGGGGPGRGGMGGRGIDEMLERFPDITVADLKVGDVIAVSSTKNATIERIRAIKLLAGVEPFLRVAAAQAAAGGQRGGGNLSLDIPGLDGFGGQ